jgi:hypothetical protein
MDLVRGFSSENVGELPEIVVTRNDRQSGLGNQSDKAQPISQ